MALAASLVFPSVMYKWRGDSIEKSKTKNCTIAGITGMARATVQSFLDPRSSGSASTIPVVPPRPRNICKISAAFYSTSFSQTTMEQFLVFQKYRTKLQ